MQSVFIMAVATFVLALPNLSVASEQVSPASAPWLRMHDAAANLKLNRQGKWLAFTKPNGQRLQLLEIATNKIYLVSEHQVGPSLFWSPDGFRLFFRESAIDPKSKKIKSTVRAYDISRHQKVMVEEIEHASGHLTFDPRELRMFLLTESGVRSNRLYLPNERLARWQIAMHESKGNWVVSQTAVFWLTHNGLTMEALQDDKTGIESFDISSDGRTIAWATKDDRVYVSLEGEKAQFVGYGRDPKWHPEKTWLVYAGARRVGNRTVRYDLRLYDMARRSGRFLTAAQQSDERWPLWSEDGKRLYFTRSQSTDLFSMDFSL